MVDLTSVWPTWGKTGSQPSDNSDYSPGDNPKAESFNHLWHHIQNTFSTVETWINDRETDLSIDNSGNVTVENGTLVTKGGNLDVRNDVAFDSGSTILFPDDSQNESLSDFTATGSPSLGTELSYSLDINGEELLEVSAETGVSGITAKQTVVKGDEGFRVRDTDQHGTGEGVGIGAPTNHDGAQIRHNNNNIFTYHAGNNDFFFNVNNNVNFTSPIENAYSIHQIDNGEPSTPTDGAVRWYDDTAGEYKIKFDDGTVKTIAAK